ncbi:Type 1 glutamine amidotransferase-like domain-containing protein [Virgibacillus kekensis]|uniref:Type 1 glutamine amidotransferase-like domain-containing protein n=1 Tax=Virgibacillus kekensis TaxID=202261 RepID=A0ABV9DLQ7_9BACI
MGDRHLFMFGAGPPFTNRLGRRFAECALNERGKVAVLFIERDGWKEYMVNYTGVLQENGIPDFAYLPLSKNPGELVDELSTCTGIIIGGGDTERYRNSIVETEIGTRIIEMYQSGAPVAGFSAGALISPAHCVIAPVDNREKKHLFLKGLGLIHNCVISAHYSTWQEENNLKAAINRTGVPVGYGIDDGAGIYFQNEIRKETDGGKVYSFINESKKG